MRREKTKSDSNNGFSLIELLVVVSITMILVGIAVPNIMQGVRTARLRAAAGELSGIIQDARILAAKNNKPYGVRYQLIAGSQTAFVDLNQNGSWDSGEPIAYFSNKVSPASGAPTGTGGQPTAYITSGDCASSCSTPYDNTTSLGFSARGLPCAFDTSTNPATCATPAANYFVYYLTDPSSTQWAAVQVTKSGRSRILVWNGSQWSN